MSGKLVREVMNNAPDDLPHAELLVLIALAEDARDTDRIARYITVDDLAHRVRVSPGRTRNLLSSLQQRCLIRGMHRARRGVRQVYQLVPLGPEHRRATLATVHELPAPPAATHPHRAAR